jgi:hypothetical protein
MNMCEKNGDHSTSVNVDLENLHTQMYQNLRLTLFFLEDPFP